MLLSSKSDSNVKIAVIIKTVPNRKSLLWLLNSTAFSLEKINFRFYIADEKPLDTWKVDLYKALKEQGHYIKIWDSSVAVTVARNHLIKELKDEEYVLRVDDDFELGGEFKINKLITLLKGSNQFDFCTDIERQIGEAKKTPSGQIRIDNAHIIFYGDRKPPVIKIKNDSSWKFKKMNGVRYAQADYMRNLILLKRHCFKKVQWNENLKFSGEHLDFYLELKKNGFTGVFTPDSIHLHRDDLKRDVLTIEEETKWRKFDVKVVKNKELVKKWNGNPIMVYGMKYKIQKKLKKIKNLINIS